MAKRPLEGGRIRRIRTEKRLRQSAVAAESGISASYLNLIEHNRRPVAGALLNRIAAALDVEPSDLSEGTEAALVAALDASVVAMPDGQAPTEPSEAFAARFPGWARAMTRQVARVEELERLVESLNDRLVHDPYLAASLHNVLSTVTSIRSTAAILTSGDEIEPEWQARFHRNIHEDSRRLAEAADSLVTYLEGDAARSQRSGLPQDEVDAWLEQRGWCPDAHGDDAALTTKPARDMAARLIARYRADAKALSDAAIIDLLADTGVDPMAIASRAGVPPDLVMRRLGSMSDAAFHGGQAPGLVICDASGTVTYRRPVRGFDPPRYGAACAIWPLFEAIQRPGTPVHRRIVVRARDTVAFEAFAFAHVAHAPAFDAPPVVEATMLVAPTTGDGGIGVGTSCRVCAEADCPARREPSVLRPAQSRAF